MTKKELEEKVEELEYRIDGLEQKIITAKKPLAHVSVGDRFIEKSGEEYILACTEIGKIALISIVDGNRWTKPTKVETLGAISVLEFKKTWGTSGVFKKKKEGG